MRTGSSELLILIVLTERPLYGYEIAQVPADYQGDEGTYSPALALLLMVLTVLAYARCRRQDRQLAILLGGTTLLFVPALLEHVTWRGGAGGAEWRVVLRAWMLTLLLPLLALPVQWTSQGLWPQGQSKE